MLLWPYPTYFVVNQFGSPFLSSQNHLLKGKEERRKSKIKGVKSISKEEEQTLAFPSLFPLSVAPTSITVASNSIFLPSNSFAPLSLILLLNSACAIASSRCKDANLASFACFEFEFEFKFDFVFVFVDFWGLKDEEKEGVKEVVEKEGV